MRKKARTRAPDANPERRRNCSLKTLGGSSQIEARQAAAPAVEETRTGRRSVLLAPVRGEAARLVVRPDRNRMAEVRLRSPMLRDVLTALASPSHHARQKPGEAHSPGSRSRHRSFDTAFGLPFHRLRTSLEVLHHQRQVDKLAPAGIGRGELRSSADGVRRRQRHVRVAEPVARREGEGEGP
jgi:hypothetical protein